MAGNRKIRIMILSDSPLAPTGFSNQSTHIARMLAKTGEFEVFFLAANGFNAGATVSGMEIKNVEMENSFDLPFTVLTGRAPYAADVISEYCKKYEIDILFCLLDTFMLMGVQGLPFGWFLGVDASPAKFVMYFPSDGGYFPWQCEAILRKSIRPIAMAKYGQSQVADLFGVVSGYIPHGTDQRLFYPLTQEEKAQARAKYKIPQDAFVFGNVSRNQGRKMMGTGVEAFAKFMKKNPNANAYFFMHTDPNDSAQYTSLDAIAQRYGIQNRIIYSGMKADRGFPIEKMREIYGIMDVQLNSTTGEGWGITMVEGMACGIPSIVTDYTTPREIFNGDEMGWMVPVAAEIIGSWGVLRGFVQVDDVLCQCGCKQIAKKGMVTIMEEVFKSPEQIKIKGEKCREKFLQEYSWDIVDQKWVNELKKIMNM